MAGLVPGHFVSVTMAHPNPDIRRDPMTGKTETIEVDAETAAVLKARAEERGVSVAAVVAELVPVADDEASLAELDRRWAAVAGGEATVPHAEVERWLQTWGTPDFRPWSER
jgi:predicted transcriptional regulator